MSKMGQVFQRMQEGEPEKFEPDPLYDERRDWEEQLTNDPGYTDFLIKEANKRKQA